MPVNNELAREQWNRYVFMRDNGHLDYVEKANKCDAFFCGDQWAAADKAALAAVRRPALTINKILGTVSNLTGDQISMRSETTFKPLHVSGENLSMLLEVLWKQVSQVNRLQWRKTDVFEDGAITSRGYFDQRLEFRDSLQGELVITVPNPRNVIIDPDAEEYDPDTWKDVILTKWLSVNDIEVMFSAEDAEYLRSNSGNPYISDIDAMQRGNDRFGGALSFLAYGQAAPDLHRNIRVLERQYKKITKAKFFADLETGDMRMIPENWDREKIGMVMQRYNLGVIDKVIERIRFTTTAGNVVLHDEWSPYKHFTIVPYFPYFRRGKTVGVVENLLDPQELLNKVSSQELHVVNTTANSGWKLKKNSLGNMSVEELEQRGAQTGIVLELEDTKDAEKILPNQIPTGLERISFKAEEHIQTISNVDSNALGQDREDVAAKAIKAKRARGAVNQLRVMDNLLRTEHILVRNSLDIFQQYYTEPRIYRATYDNPEAGVAHEDLDADFIKLNQFDEAAGRIVNDLTLGTYEVTIVSVPPRDTIEESEFEQVVALRELGIMIPDHRVISHSLLREKRDIIREMQEAAQSPEAQEQRQLQLGHQQAVVEKAAAEVDKTKADALLKTANAQAKVADIATAAPGPAGSGGKGGDDLLSKVLENRAKKGEQEAEHGLRREEMSHEAAMQEREMAHDAQQGAMQHERDLQKAVVTHEQAKESQQPQTAAAEKIAKAKSSLKPPKKDRK